ncbi:MAG: hypothetical protein ACI9CP_001548, partial [Cryomorphaceae bacterium]
MVFLNGVKKNKTYKPDPVSFAETKEFHHLSSPAVASRIEQPTLRDRASSSQTSVYMALQSAGFTS